MTRHQYLALCLAAFCAVAAAPLHGAVSTPVPWQSTWKYLDNGSDQGTAWVQPAYNDTSWSQGAGPLGYGDGDEATVVGYGPNSNNKYPTTYFRHTFALADPSAWLSARVSVQRDDGIIVYLNGTEIFRDHMPAGAVTYQTYSSSPAIGGEDETAILPANVDPSLLVAGNNVLAVEIHQVNATSSDISFDLEFLVSTDEAINEPPDVVLTNPADNSFYSLGGNILLGADASDNDGTISTVEFYRNDVRLGFPDSAPPYASIWFNAQEGEYDLYAVATDNLGARSTSAVHRVTVLASTAPFVIGRDPAPGAVTVLNSVTVTFNEPVIGVVPELLLINDLPAVTVVGEGNVFTFGFSQPPAGTVSVAFDVDLTVTDVEGNAFDVFGSDANWTYDLADIEDPTAASITPRPGTVLGGFSAVEVMFDEPVTGVDAGDLTANGTGATSVTGSGSGPYVFQFTPVGSGNVALAWGAGHGIADLAETPNGFGGGSWNYNVNPALATDIVINEILANNLTSLGDEDRQKQGWIELRNRGSSAVNLNGWSLSDDPAVPGKWEFPDITLGAGQYLVIFASGKNRAVTAAGLTNHVNFQLSVSGAYLGLYRADYPRVVEDAFAPAYPEQRGDISYGRRADGTLAWFSALSPGGPNPGAQALDGLVAKPHASVGSGLFNHPFSVALSTETPGARIHYTLDNNTPTAASPEYIDPIPIAGTPRKGTVVLRAAAFRDGQLPSEILTRTYIFPEHVLTQPANPDGFPSQWVSPGGLNDSEADYEMDPDVVNDPARNNRQLIIEGLQQLPTLSIVSDMDRMWSTTQGFYVRKEGDNPTLQQLCNIEFFTPDGSEDGFNVTGGLKIVGGTSSGNASSFWKGRKLSMRILFKGEFGGTKLRYRLYPDSPVDSFDTLNVDAGSNMTWPYNGTSNPDDQRLRAVMVRDQFNSDLQLAMGGAAPEGRFVHVYMNGLYWGVYDLHERPDHTFASDYFGGEKEEYTAIKHTPSDIINGTATDYNSLFSTYGGTALADNGNYLAIQNLVDVPAFIDYMIMNLWTGNEDWSHHNWYVTKRNTPDGRWRFHSWDAEHSLKTVTENKNNDTNDGNAPTTLYHMFRNNAEFRMLFADHVHRHFFNGGVLYVDPANSSYDPAHPERNRPAALFMKRINEIIVGPVVAESARWGDTGQTGTPRANNPLTYHRDFLNELDALMGVRNTSGHGNSFNYFPNRSEVVLNQFRSLGLYPGVAAPSFNRHGGRVASGFDLTMSAPQGTIYYTLNGSDPRLFGGGTLPAALEYTGTPIELTGTTRVRARVLSPGGWSALNEAEFVIEELTVPIRLTEIMYHPVGDEPYEFLELRNVGSTPIDLSNFTLDGVGFTFALGATIAPGATLVLANNDDPSAFAARYPGVTVYGYFSGNLDNGGETITIRDADRNHVHSVAYDDENGWPLSPDGDGPSLELISESGESSDPSNWRASTGPNGTPGLPPAPTFPGEIVLNELISENISAVANGDTFPDYVEIYNSGGQAADLTGWSLSDQGVAGQYPLPQATVIAAGGYLVVWLDSPTNTTPGLHAGFALDNDGDSVFLFDAQGQRVDAVRFGLIPADYSLGRLDGSWKLNTPSAGEANVAAAVASASSVGINEWMANPLDGGDDWIELYNRSTLPVALRGSYLGTSNAIFQIRSHTFLPGQGFLQLFAEERQGVDQLDFKLPASGGRIDFYDATGLEVERVVYGPQSAGVSSGRIPDGSTTGVVAFPGSASPGASNFLQNYDGPVFSEILARNVSSVVAPWGANADYVEFFNGTGAVFDMSGMSLSTEGDQPGDFVIPSGTQLPANGYLLIWCDGTRPATLTSGGPLNAGFGLPGGGGSLFLFQATGQLATSVAYGPQVANLPIGSSGGLMRLLAEATPGAANAAPSALGSVSSLRINEWMASASSDNDWFELYNTSALPVQMDGLFLTDDPSIQGQTKTQIGPLSFIGARSWVRWEADGNPGQGPNHVSFNLNDSGENLYLYDAEWTIVDSIAYGLQTENVSEGRIPDGAANIVAFPTTASPEESNFLPLGDVVISEVLTHTDPPLEDALELQNLGAEPVDIGGYYLSDGQDDFQKYRIPDGTIIPAGGFVVFYEHALNGGAGSMTPFTFDSVHGDVAWLSQADGAGSLTGFRTRAGFDAAANGVSFGRWQTSVGVDFPAQVARSFGQDNPGSLEEFRMGTGMANAGPRVGPLVVNEIMYHPLPDAGANNSALEEYIEIYNADTEEVSLEDPSFPGNTWQLAGGVEFVFPRGASLAGRCYLLVVSFDPVADPASAAQFRTRYGIPVDVPLYGPFKGQLSNEGETVRLVRPDTPQGPGPDEGFVPQILVEAIAYDDASPWPAEADGGGVSLQRRRPASYGNEPVNWKGDAPTPGKANVPGYGYVDTDKDGMPDEFESAYSFNANLAQDADLDADGDQRTNYEEFLDGTDPRSAASVAAPPVILDHPESQLINPGTSVTLMVQATGMAPLRYQWYQSGLPIAGADSAGLVIENATSEDRGRYHVTVWNDAGFVVSEAALVRVAIPPRILEQPVGATVSPGEPVTLTVNAVGTGLLQYQWQKNGQEVEGATGPSYAIASAGPEDAGVYTVEVSDSEGSVVSDPAVLTVLVPPTVVNPVVPLALSVLPGQDLVLNVTVTNAATLPIYYRWIRGFTPLLPPGSDATGVLELNETSSTIVIPSVQPSGVFNSHIISVVISNQAFIPTSIAQAHTNAYLTFVMDGDQDGMDDAFELQYGLDPEFPDDAQADIDQDGMTSLEEYQAGTDPTDPNSYLRVGIVQAGAGQGSRVVLEFRAEANKSYTVLYRDSVAGGAWSPLSHIPAAGTVRQMELIDPQASQLDQRIYRLVTPMQP